MSSERAEHVADSARREELIQQRLRGAGAPARSIPRASRDQPLPLSAGQEQMWVLHQLTPHSPAYLMSWLLRLSGELDGEGVRWAWQRIIARHEVLRTRYVSSADEPAQVIDPPGDFSVQQWDLTGHPVPGRMEQARQLAERERRRPFDLAAEHPVRVALIQVEPRLHLMVIVIHHIAGDGVSYRQFAAELSAFYRQHVEGVPADLPDPELQYVDYAVWERERRERGELRAHLEYWRHRLAGLSELPLPVDTDLPEAPPWRGSVVDIPVSESTAQRVRDLAAAHRASPAMVLLAVYQAMLAEFTGTTDVAVGVPVTARTRPELERLVGYAVNSIVVRSNCHRDQAFTDLLTQVRQHLLDAFDRRDVPFPWLVSELRPARGGVSNPLFRVAFDMNPTEGGAFSLPGLTVSHLRDRPDPVAKFDLTLHVEESPTRQLYVQLEYAVTTFRAQTAQRFADGYGRLLATVLDDPHLPLAKAGEMSPLATPVGAAATPVETLPAGDGVADEAVVSAAGRRPRRSERADVSGLIERLLPVWCSTLEIETVEADDNFFDLGGDSIRAVALAGRLRAVGLDVSAADIFTYQSVAELAELLADRQQPSESWTATAPFALLDPGDRGALPEGVVDAYPLGAAQLGMIVEMRARPELSRYQDTTSFLIRDDGEFSLAALQAAAQQVVDRHEALRTSFALTGFSVPLQLVHQNAVITVGVTDHGDLGPDGWEPKLRAYSAQRRQSPQDLTVAPLIQLHAHLAAGTTHWWLSVTECHLILEGWSFHTLLMEILSAYRELREGRRPATVPPSPFRFVDHIVAEAAAAQSKEDHDFWRQMVADRVPVTLPSAWQGDRDLPEERYQHLVSLRDLEADLRQLASQTRTSMKAVLLAAHLKVMGSLVGTDRFFTGLVCDARPEVEGADRVPGMYLNTLPFALPAGAGSWRALVTAVFDALAEMWPHRRFPMQLLQQEFGSGDRLLEVMFNYLDFHQVDKELVDWPATVDETDNEFALHVFTISGVLKFNTTTHALSREAALRLGACYRAVLEQMAWDPDGDATANWLPAGEDSDRYGAPATVPAAVADRVQERPETLAIRCGAESLTYRQLDTAAERLAGKLRERGVGRGGVVAVVPTREVWTPAVPLAVWKAGAAWMPLASRSATKLILDLAAQGRITAVIAPPDVAGDIRSVDLPIVELSGLDRPRGTTPGGATDPRRATPVASPAPGDAAVVLPTGRDGDQADVVLSHRALAAALARLRAGLAELPAAAGPGVTWLYSSTAASWAALSELFGPLITGGLVMVVSQAGEGRQLRELVRAGEVTHLQATPLVAEELLPEEGLPAGTIAVIGGDPHAWAESRTAGGCALAEGFAEAAGWVVMSGRPLPGVLVRVLDEELRPVPVGVRGELYVGGPDLADGLYGAPAETAARFLPDPFGAAGARMVRTGTLARFCPQGRLELLGPISGQLSSQGKLLDLAQARAELRRQPGVQNAFVLLRREAGQTQRLIGYVRLTPDVEFDPVERRRRLAERLPRRLVPEAVVAVSHWPLTPHGGLDVERLPALPGPADDSADDSGEVPWDEQFDQLLRQVLPFLPADGELRGDLELAEAGLDSLTIVELLVALEQAYGIVIPDELLSMDKFATPMTLWEAISTLRDEA